MVEPVTPGSGWRSVVAGFLGIVSAVTPLTLAVGADALVPSHYNAGGLGFHLVGAALFGASLLVVFGGVLLGARALSRAPWLPTAGVFVALYSPVAGWKLFDAANVAFDRSPPTPHRVYFLRFVAQNKGPPTTTLTSWRGPGTVALDVYTREDERQPGRPVQVVTCDGALGREYVLEVNSLPAEAPTSP